MKPAGPSAHDAKASGHEAKASYSGNAENRKSENGDDDSEDKTAAHRAEAKQGDDEQEDELKSSRSFCVGARVERELDGLWFPGTVTAADPDADAFEVEYDEDLNREADVSADELRHLDPSRIRSAPSVREELTPQQREMLRKDSMLMQAPDYDPNKEPTVVLHHRGETNVAAAGYIINGLENNIAAGNGLRGIRWLRVNTF